MTPFTKCEVCEVTIVTLVTRQKDADLVAFAEPRYCPACGHELDTEPWKFLAFSPEDLWSMCEGEEGYNPQMLFDRFVRERGQQADEACGHAVMEALRTEFAMWLGEIDEDTNAA